MEKTNENNSNHMKESKDKTNFHKKKESFLNNKTQRNFHNHKHKQNKKKTLLHQLEFYFSDINLYNDKFLRNLTNKDADKGVEMNIILNFNKIKDILSELEGDNEKINFIKKAVDMSRKIKIVNNKIVRIENFDMNKISQSNIDNRIIYAENIPKDVTHETLYQVFTKWGKVVHISIPKFQQSRQVKGFAFITYDSEEECTRAKEKGNNSIPKEFLTAHSGEISPLYIITKKEWLEKKEEFKKLKHELINENKDIFAECFSQNVESNSSLTPGTLVKLTNLPSGTNIDKYSIRAWVSNFVEPAFVDYNSENNQCIIRFSHKILAESFLKKLSNEEDFRFHGKKVTADPISAEEEKEYFNKVEKAKEEVRKKRKKSKSKGNTSDDKNPIIKSDN